MKPLQAQLLVALAVLAWAGAVGVEPGTLAAAAYVGACVSIGGLAVELLSR